MPIIFSLIVRRMIVACVPFLSSLLLPDWKGRSEVTHSVTHVWYAKLYDGESVQKVIPCAIDKGLITDDNL